MKKIVILILLIMLTACQFIQQKSSVLDNLECNLPCWKGITPGKTDMQELISLLNNIPNVDKDSIADIGVPGGYFSSIVSCYIIESKTMTRFYAYFIKDKLALISLDYVEGDWNLTLNDVTGKIGEVDKILISNYGNDTFINFISPSNGVAFGYNTINKPAWWKKKITQQNKIGWIGFFDPILFTQLMESGELSFGILFGQEAIDNIQPWAGYGDIEEKYQIQK